MLYYRRVNSSTIKKNIITMGGTVTDDSLPGLAAAVLTIPQTINVNNLTGTITYKYHNHSSSCWVAPITGKVNAEQEDPNSPGYYYGVCQNCGTWVGGAPCTHTCKAGYYSCGYTQGQIIGAEIEF